MKVPGSDGGLPETSNYCHAFPATHAAARAIPAICRDRLSVREPSPARISNAFPDPPKPLVASAGIEFVEDEDEEDDDDDDDDADETEDVGLGGPTPVVVIAVAVALVTLILSVEGAEGDSADVLEVVVGAAAVVCGSCEVDACVVLACSVVVIDSPWLVVASVEVVSTVCDSLALWLDESELDSGHNVDTPSP
ncbi:hypothetical protein PVAR5_3737 [Paecilomyces variotii No. 5]|uniref:Uncharacterized protein n=1 Tax=Byssochlamys spectabilis (strain No. 5 / NBRC 109023) TaxID=1356009 RepID=V5FST1_BYSSN|nr:hypothetical protein PVAR5_3737 [Paecilomyces variotii No. 5]